MTLIQFVLFVCTPIVALSVLAVVAVDWCSRGRPVLPPDFEGREVRRQMRQLRRGHYPW